MRKKRGFRRRLWSAALGTMALMTAAGSVSGFAVFARAEREASAWMEADFSEQNSGRVSLDVEAEIAAATDTSLLSNADFAQMFGETAASGLDAATEAETSEAGEAAVHTLTGEADFGLSPDAASSSMDSAARNASETVFSSDNPSASSSDSTASTLAPGALLELELSSQAQVLAFTPAANGEYGLYAFPDGETSVHAELLAGDRLLAEADGGDGLKLLGRRLIAGTEYHIRLTGAGCVRVELTRTTLSRCFDQPLELTDEYTKLIARAGDVHWYAVTAEAAANALLSVSNLAPGLRLRAWLFDGEGRLLTESDALPSGSCALGAAMGQGQTLWLRIAAEDGAVGQYRLKVHWGEARPAAAELRLSASELRLNGRDSAELTVSALPEGASELVIFDSLDRSVAEMADGAVKSRMDGRATITAYAFGGATAQCTVEVARVAVESIALSERRMTLKVGETHALQVTLSPENATDRRVTFVTDDEKIVTVDASGTLTAVGEGTARVVAIAADGSFTDMAYVAVEPAGRRYRALLIGEEEYASTVDKRRPGATLSVDSLASMLRQSEHEGEGYAVTTLMDAPRDQVIAAIRSAFADAAQQDLSIMYITCHGFYRSGMTFFVMADGSVLAASDLEAELRRIPGEILVLADCCGSGGLMGGAAELTEGVTGAFRGAVGSAVVRGSRIRVIASAGLDQDSYRISFSDESGMATVFARALCDAAGWSIDRGAPGSMGADTDYDGAITFEELCRYTARRVQWYLQLAGGYEQDVRFSPEGDDLELFFRE